MKSLTTILALLLFFSLSSCGQEKSSSAQIITADSLKKTLNTPGRVLLDVRTPEEFQLGHIAGAINIDFYDDNFATALDTLNKELHYDVYCRSGNRSGKTVDMMLAKGFKSISHYDGGILDWKERKMELVK